MSMASFMMFVGGAIGTNLNGMILEKGTIGIIFLTSSIAMLILAVLSMSVLRYCSKK
ncbi:hypothetical protein TPELB_06150 [Terrisporobacter petrolearius]|uniref:Uncharacterized protein n=2 Tax=Terrisporobacter petrolearius TaxID=1460447 RepID=A0ABZ3FCC8_9FIRM